jgi:hypothetical protein
LVDRDLLANIRSNLFYFDLFASSNLVLLATGFYDRVHISPFSTVAEGNFPLEPPATAFDHGMAALQKAQSRRF